MILTFAVSVDVPFGGEKWVPYLKHILAVRGNFIGRTRVRYEEWLSDKGDKKAEFIEKEAYYAGRIEL